MAILPQTRLLEMHCIFYSVEFCDKLLVAGAVCGYAEDIADVEEAVVIEEAAEVVSAGSLFPL